jgi:hypothetical protein
MSEPLSPDAQAVWDTIRILGCSDEYQATAFKFAAAVIRAAVDRVIPNTPLHLNDRGTRHWHRGIREGEIRLALLAIAAELEGGNATTTQEEP